MRRPPKISVITVALNDLTGLRSMVASLQKQTYPNVEHLVIDGGSTDGTQAWLTKYVPNYPVRWISEKDSGIFDAMNKGAALAKGELIVFMNAGDAFSSSSSLSEVAELWQKENWDWAYGQMEYVDSVGSSRGFTSQLSHSQRWLELGTRFAPHQATYVKREFFEALDGFDLSFEYACDQEFAIRAGKISAPFVSERVMAKFLEGGVHSQTTYFRRERIYHRMRVKNGVLFRNSVVLDRLYCESMALYREVREFLGDMKRSLVSVVASNREAHQ